MKPRPIGTRTIAMPGIRPVRRCVRYLGLTLGFLAARDAAGQQIDWPRLTVRPHDMATGTQTIRAGEQALDSLENYLVYVPEQCVGTRRCPLVVFLPPRDSTPKTVVQSQRQFADQYGMTLLVPAQDPSAQPELEDFSVVSLSNLDAALKQVLRRYAIDPDKIAFAGYALGYNFWKLGQANTHVFSRVASLSVMGVLMKLPELPAPPTPTTRFYLSGGLGEYSYLWHSGQLANALRRDGYAVTHVLELRGYDVDAAEYGRMWRWLQESWDTTKAAPAPPPAADRVPVLTAEALAKLTTFWMHFDRAPDSIRQAARRAYQKEITLPVGEESLRLTMTDMPALAARYPVVRAALEKAGLTAQQHDMYRLALVAASAAWQVEGGHPPTPPTSVLGQNIAFMKSHRHALVALGATGMWTMGTRGTTPALPPAPGRLTVRPHTMALTTRTSQSGMQIPALGLGDVRFYVPPPCAGTRRCPLIVVINGNWLATEALAAKYEMDFLFLNSIGRGEDAKEVIGAGRATRDPGVPSLIRAMPPVELTGIVDSALKYLLRHVAIDPHRIAITGNSADGARAWFLAANNPDVFSRVAPTSQPNTTMGLLLPANDTAQQFYLSIGSEENWWIWAMAYNKHTLQAAGHRVKAVLELREHVPLDYYMYDKMLQWFQDSWTGRDKRARAVRRIDPNALPRLTPETLTQLTAFWTGFYAGPDSIAHRTARMKYRTEVLLPVHGEWLSHWEVDMPTLAAHDPAVAAALQAAGLTATQEEAARLGLITAQIAAAPAALRKELVSPPCMTWDYLVTVVCRERVDTSSILGRNTAFYLANEQAARHTLQLLHDSRLDRGP